MTKILFICLGNICRSPMAEFVMKDLVEKAGLADEFQIDSAATCRDEIGNPVYPPARRKLAEHGISFEHCPSGIDTVSILVSTEALAPAREEILQQIQERLQPDHVSVEDGLALIAVVGQGMIYAKGTAARIFRVIADANINIRMIDQGSSELNIIIAVKETDYELAIRSLYHAVERVL